MAHEAVEKQENGGQWHTILKMAYYIKRQFILLFEIAPYAPFYVTRRSGQRESTICFSVYYSYFEIMPPVRLKRTAQTKNKD